ncbi:MAG: 7-carboxy-7-deazaguanine synthase QueE [Paludibacteraceae bacterium]|nr:7-carboxy-7-deazaguanine synthase QueE [Paludibacteraceae bacterium]
MRKINEIFYSLQGEGRFTGTAATFIRFSGCNLKCDFCDTTHEDGRMMTDEEIIAEALKHPTRHVVLTGGEPSLWIDEAFVALLKEKGFYVQIETNGTHALPSNIDWVTFSPKKNWTLTKSNELKIVYQEQDLSEWKDFDCQFKYLQPCSCSNTEKVVDYIKEHPEWKLSVQLHKLIQIP